MELLNNLNIQVSFNAVRNILDKEMTPVSENGKANIQRSIQFLDTVIQSIDSLGMGTEEKSNVYYFVPNLKEMITISTDDQKIDQKIQKSKVAKSRKYFLGVKSNLELLQNDPQKLYSSSSKSDSLMHSVSKIIDIYSGSTHIVERDITLPERFL